MLEMASDIAFYVPESEWEFQKDGIGYVIQLDKSYVAYFTDDVSKEAWGETPEKAKKALLSGDRQIDHEIEEWISADISEEIESFEYQISTKQNKKTKYIPGKGLFIS